MAGLFANVDTDCKICFEELECESGTCCVILNNCSSGVKHAFHTLCVIKWAMNKKKIIERIRDNGGVLDAGVFNVMCAACRIPLEKLREMPGEPKYVMNAKINISKEAVNNSLSMRTTPEVILTKLYEIGTNFTEILSPANEALGFRIARCSTSSGCYSRWFIKMRNGCCGDAENAPAEYCYTCEEKRRPKEIPSHPALAWMKNIVRCDYCGDSDPTFIERTEACSHIKCTKCNVFEGCAVCGGHYDRQMSFPEQMLRSQPYCAKPTPGAKNKEGKPLKVGRCMCKERLTIEREQNINDFSRKLALHPEAVLYGVASFATNPDQPNPYDDEAGPSNYVEPPEVDSFSDYIPSLPRIRTSIEETDILGLAGSPISSGFSSPLSPPSPGYSPASPAYSPISPVHFQVSPRYTPSSPAYLPVRPADVLPSRQTNSIFQLYMERRLQRVSDTVLREQARSVRRRVEDLAATVLNTPLPPPAQAEIEVIEIDDD